MKDFQELETLLAAKMPIVAIESHEEGNILKMLERFATLNDRTLWRWSVTEGLRRAVGGESAYNTIRIEDARPRVVLSASCGIEGQKVLPYKPLLDHALELAGHAPAHCVILAREQAAAELTSGRDHDWAALEAHAEPVANRPGGRVAAHEAEHHRGVTSPAVDE